MLASARARTALAAVALLAGCGRDESHFARVTQITENDQTIGGSTANGRVGDFLMENDQIRAIVEQGGVSFQPTSVGGTIIDVDLQRPQAEFRGGHGLDALGQIAPVANLNIAWADNPVHVRITPSKEGVEVTAATVTQPILHILRALIVLIDTRFAASPLNTSMYNEYELRPGERLIRMTTTVGFNVPFCPVEPEDGCNPECDDPIYDSDCDCPVPARCTAASVVQGAPLPDRPVSSILDVLLGDMPRPFGSGTCTGDGDCDQVAGETCVTVTRPTGGDLGICRAPDARDAGEILGDLLVFGGHLTPFVRGIGYDTETDIRRLFDQGKDTLSQPLDVDAIFATGDRISLGYQSANGHILVPIFRGPFSLGATHAASCPTSQPQCLQRKVVRFERWLSVGEGDVASAQAPLFTATDAPTGLVSGSVTEEPSGNPRSGVEVYALRDPRALTCDAACTARCGAVTGTPAAWTLDQLRAMNRCRTQEAQYPAGNSAVETFANTDPGTDPILDGNFSMRLPPGDYVLVAVDGNAGMSSLVPISVAAGASIATHLALPEPATLEYAIFDETGATGPGKLTIGHLPGAPCTADSECPSGQECRVGSCDPPWGALVPLELGGDRPHDGVLTTQQTTTGMGTIELPPGDYEVLMSRGPHYSVDRQVVTLAPRLTTRAEGFVRRVVDRQDWIAAGLHVHAQNSVDSGTSNTHRVTTFLAEDMDFLSSSDHDWITDYDPLVREMKVSDRLDTMVGLEATTQEIGHYIAFPLEHQQWQDGVRIPENGAPQWRGLPPGDIISLMRQLATDGPPVVVDIPHPYDYFDSYQVDPVSLEPQDSLLVVLNDLLAPTFFTGDFEVMELVNTKNFHRIRRATVSEVSSYGAALDDLINQVETGVIDEATYDRRLLDLAAEATRKRLHRTVAEQEAALAGEGDLVPCVCSSSRECGSGRVCEPSTMTCQPTPGSSDPPPPADNLCRRSRGVVDDWFNMLNRGMFRTGVAGADAHGREDGFMRTMIRTDGTTPPFIDDDDVVNGLLEGHAFVSNGPMIHFSIDGSSAGAQIGDTVTATAGSPVTLHVRVEKAGWYDVDRIEIYRNGHLSFWANGCNRGRGNTDADPDTLPCIDDNDGSVVAWDQAITDTPSEDSWYVVLVYGLDGRSMAPVYTSQILADIGTPEIMQRLFTIIPGLQEFTYPRVPGVFPVFPFAFTNPIWVDVGGDGWTPLLPPTSWCRPGDFGC